MRLLRTPSVFGLFMTDCEQFSGSCTKHVVYSIFSKRGCEYLCLRARWTPAAAASSEVLLESMLADLAAA